MHLAAERRWDQVWYLISWRVRGFDFGRMTIEDMGLDPQCCNAHLNSGGPDLVRALQATGVSEGSRILDFGCGKGGAVLTMCGFPFSEIVGLDISPELAAIAEANSRRAHTTRVKFVQADAASYQDLDRFTHLYMFNPFPCRVVEAVCENVKASLVRRERKLTLIYKNPVCDPVVLNSGIFELQCDVKYGVRAPDWECFRVYVHSTR